MASDPYRILHPITRMIIGGAQENTMLTVDYLTRLPEYAGKYQLKIISGPQTGTEGSLIEETRRRGVDLTILPVLLRQISPVNDLKALFNLRKMMKGGRYDIVHTHSSKAGVLGRLAAKSVGVSIILHTVHGWSFHERMIPRQRSFYVALEKIAAWAGDHMIVVSPKDIDKGLAQGIGKRSDYTLIRSGIELDRFGYPNLPPTQVRQSLGIPLDALVVGSVTRLSPQKAPLDLVASFAKIATNAPHVYFVIVGDGDMRTEVEAELNAAGIRQQTILTGLRRDIPELLATFDVFVLSSLWEGLPRVLPQAMATGLPIVCTAADGSAEAVKDGVNGFLTPPGQPQAIARKTQELLQDKPLRRKMGVVGKAKAPEFGARKMVKEIDALYQTLLLSN